MNRIKLRSKEGLELLISRESELRTKESEGTLTKAEAVELGVIDRGGGNLQAFLAGKEVVGSISDDEKMILKILRDGMKGPTLH